MSTFNSVSHFRLKRSLETLAGKEGRGTELISLYIPPGRRIHEVMAGLREEYGTASNIKSRTTRKNVQEAIEKVSQRLKLFKEPPPNGLVIFCGAISRNGPGTERMEIYVLEPPEPINVYFYRCDSKFHVEPLAEMLKERNTYAILLIDINEALLATLTGRRVDILRQFTSGIPGKHRAGGQSARRFERIREQEVNDYMKRVGNHANEDLAQMDSLRGIILGGPGPTKYDFQEGEYLNYMLKKKIVASVDTTYIGERGVDEIVEKSQDVLKGVRYMEEKQLVQKFLYEIGHSTGMAAYGEKDVRNYLKDGAVDILLLSEKINSIRVITRCKNCGFESDCIIPHYDLPVFEQKLLDSHCNKCDNGTMELVQYRDLIDEYLELAGNVGTRVELISVDTEDGQQFLNGFEGIGAILRYKLG